MHTTLDKCIDFNLGKRTNGTHNRLQNRSTSNQYINIENELGYVVQHHRFNVESAMGALRDHNTLSLSIHSHNPFPNLTNI
jgi:hypothetical protein